MSGPKTDALLTDNLAVIERAVAFACRRYALRPEDAEEFASVVKLKLIENDYAILEAYEGRSSFATFISIVVQRMAIDFRIHEWGKWHASAEAKRLGPLAVDIERLLHREGRTTEEAATILHESRETVEQLAAGLPARAPRRRDVAIEEAERAAITEPAATEDLVFAGERRKTSEKVSAIVSALLSRVPDEEQLILQLRFEDGMTVAQISRALQIDQKVTYRRIERRMRELKAELLGAGVDPRDVLDLIGRDDAVLRFDFGKEKRRPSIPGDERAQAHTEVPR
ncbi:MAG TPA: sigma-70 family RNA polymerase sigma factor [Thermoanaerobaculia bacterium]